MTLAVQPGKLLYAPHPNADRTRALHPLSLKAAMIASDLLFVILSQLPIALADSLFDTAEHDMTSM